MRRHSNTYLMRSVIAILAILTLSVTVPSSCKREPLYYLGQTPVRVVVNMDWRYLGEIPEGASIYFYPENKGQSYSFITNDVGSTTVMVPSGYYTIMVFNRTKDEFGTMHFRNINSISDASAMLNFKYSVWTGASDTVGHTVYEPESIVIGVADHIYIHDITESERDVSSAWGYRCDTVCVVPQQFVLTGSVSIRVSGLHNAKLVRAYLTGMGGGVYMVPRTTCDSLCTHTMESWSVTRDQTDYTKGYFYSQFRCFGLPDMYRQEKNPSNNRFHVEVMLVDEQTIISKDWNVGELIKEYVNDLRLTLDVGDLNLPDVKPKGGTESGFDISVGDWEDPVDIDVPL